MLSDVGLLLGLVVVGLVLLFDVVMGVEQEGWVVVAVELVYWL